MRAARTLLNVYLVAALVALRQGFSLELAVQMLLLLFTYGYAEIAWHLTRPR